MGSELAYNGICMGCLGRPWHIDQVGRDSSSASPADGGSLPWLLQSHDKHVRGGISSYKSAALGMVEIDPIHISCWEPLKLIA